MFQCKSDYFDWISDSSFDGLFAGTSQPSSIKHEDDRAIIDVEVPGAARDAITVDFEDGRLKVTAKLRGRKVEEYFTVPERIYDTSKVSAALKDGILTVTVPKLDSRSPPKKTIEIK